MEIQKDNFHTNNFLPYEADLQRNPFILQQILKAFLKTPFTVNRTDVLKYITLHNIHRLRSSSQK